MVNMQRIVALTSGQTYYLPANPQKDWQIAISVGDFSDTVVSPNGKRIMGSEEPMTIDIPGSTVYFFYVDNPRGWRLTAS
jgi:hypothetical protein